MATETDSCSQVSTQQMQTQEMTESQPQDTSANDENVWGRLLALRNRLQDYNLNEAKHSFGRGDTDHRFDQTHFSSKQISVLSKIHFIITREIEKDGSFIVVLEDKSQNGTYVNKNLVGKNKKKVLNNNDEIALPEAKHKAFVFYNCCNNDADDYPVELTMKYTMTKTLGDGTFGEVKLAYAQGSLHRVAVKIMKKKHLSKDGTPVKLNHIDTINNEIELLKKIDHPCIVKLLDLVDSSDRIFLVMELAEGGELFDKIAMNIKLTEPIAKMYFYQLLLAVKYLHDNKITHRDIKPENILLATDDEISKVKLTDFGLSKIADEMTTFCGTKTYMSPELLNANIQKYTNKVDMWSLGIVLFACLVGHVPFQSKNQFTSQYNILKGKYTMNHRFWKDVSDEAKDLVRKLIVVDPNVRLSAEEALAHPWFEDAILTERISTLFNDNVSSLSMKRSLEIEMDDNEPDMKTPKIMNNMEFVTGV